MNYYILNTANQADGPHAADWIRANAGPATLVSHGQQWVRLSEHPDFPVLAVRRCLKCGTTAASEQQFCTVCGKALPYVDTRKPPSPHLSLLNVFINGIAQMIFGQVMKGFVLLALVLVTIPTGFGPPIIVIASIVDGYLVARKLRRTGSVGPWEFFPS